MQRDLNASQVDPLVDIPRFTFISSVNPGVTTSTACSEP